MILLKDIFEKKELKTSETIHKHVKRRMFKS